MFMTTPKGIDGDSQSARKSAVKWPGMSQTNVSDIPDDKLGKSIGVGGLSKNIGGLERSLGGCELEEVTSS